MKDDTIYRKDAIAAANRTDYRGLTVEDVKKVTDEVVKELEALPSAQPDVEKMQDETLSIAADVDVTRVKRILLTQKGTQNGGLYYRE